MSGVPLDFGVAVDRARSEGWATLPGSLPDFRAWAFVSGLSEVTTRRGADAMDLLRPVAREAARPRSLSARYGIGAQPLHTDGAHQVVPPDLIVLQAAAASSTPTLLWKPPNEPWWREHWNHAVFVVNNGRRSRLATAALRSGGFRFDPGCMSPGDARARALARELEAAARLAFEHRWDGQGQLLIIDNRSALHARAAVGAADRDRALVRIAFTTGDRG